MIKNITDFATSVFLLVVAGLIIFTLSIIASFTVDTIRLGGKNVRCSVSVYNKKLECKRTLI